LGEITNRVANQGAAGKGPGKRQAAPEEKKSTAQRAETTPARAPISEWEVRRSPILESCRVT
jgi:hypothetical protein